MNRRPASIAIAVVGALLFFIGGAAMVGGRPRSGADGRISAASGAPTTSTLAAGSAGTAVKGLQARLRSVPSDYVSWAALGLAYVQQARITVDPAYYPKAEGALKRSLSIETRDNYVACAGMAALAAARHEFAQAKSWAERGLAINRSNATLYGALADALTQLGQYRQAFAATQAMVDLVPATPSLSRASYAWELRGNLDLARHYMSRALEDATTPADRAFAQYYLGDLEFNAGNAASALRHYRAGLAADAGFSANLEGKARAEAALGQTDAAIVDFTDVVSRVPQPTYLIEFGELLQSLGRTREANAQYRLFESEQKLFEANGVVGDVDPTLFHADHGQPARALEYAKRGSKSRSFIEMDDAYAWALHVQGRDQEAQGWSARALSLGTRSALFHYHAGMIQKSLGHRDAARRHLAAALQINPAFSPLWAPVARQALSALDTAS